MERSIPEFEAMLRADSEFMAQYADLRCRPQVSVVDVEVRKVRGIVRSHYPLSVAFEWAADETPVFNDLRVHGLDPLTTTHTDYQRHFDTPREAVFMEDSEDGCSVWFPLSDDGDSACRSWGPNRVPTDSRGHIAFESPHPCGRPQRLLVTLNQAKGLKPGDPLVYQFPMVDAYNPSVPVARGRWGERGLGDGVIWLPLEKPEPGDMRYPDAIRESTRGFTGPLWATFIGAIRDKFRDLEFDGGKTTTLREKVKRMHRSEQGQERGEPRLAKPAFDGNLGNGVEAPAVGWGALGYFLFFYKARPSDEQPSVVVVDSCDGHKGLYIFAGENCRRDAEDWATRGNGMNFREARRRTVRWFPHTHEWRRRVVELVLQLLEEARTN